MADRDQKKRRRRGSGVLPRLLTMAAVVAAIVFCIAIFFRVSSFTVSGNARYTEQEIVAASGIEQGDNLLLVSRTEAAAKIRAELPYIAKIRVHRQLPNSVSIEVVEYTAAAVVADVHGDLWLISADARLLEMVDETVAAAYPVLTGFEAQQPQAGSRLVTEQTNTVDAVVAILGALEQSAVRAEIVSIDLEKTYSIRMMYAEQYEVNLGGTDELTYKFTYLEQIVAELQQRDPDAGGQIDLTLETEKVARFLPW